MRDIESTLRKMHENQLKEEAEISSWTESLEKIKTRLSEIDSNIFTKI